MSTQEDAREAMAQSRQQQEQIEKSMLRRAQAEVEKSAKDNGVEEEAREALAANRQHKEHIQQSMLHRAAEETGLTEDSTPDSST